MTNLCEWDILRPLRDDEIVKMVEICAKRLPMSSRGYHFLRMNMKWNKMCRANPVEYETLIVSDYMRRKIYTKCDGIIDNCTFISISSGQNYTVFVYSDNDDELRACLIETNRIDYSLGPSFVSIEGRHRSILTEVFKSRNINIKVEEWYTSRILPKTEALRYEYEVPDDVVEGKLKVDDVDVINEVWPHRYPGSLEYLKTLVGLNDSVAIFSRADTREIRAWAILNDQFGLGMVHTLPDYRGKGYAKIVTKSLSKTIAIKYDLDVQIFVVKGNILAENMFEKLGFRLIPMPGDYSWVYTKPLN